MTDLVKSKQTLTARQLANISRVISNTGRLKITRLWSKKPAKKTSVKKTPVKPAKKTRAHPVGTPDYYRSRNLKIRYGINLETFELLRRSQNNRCKICEKEKPLHVDHCHRTGKIRALLCGACNRAIGFFGDDIPTILNAAKYLSEHGNS